MEYVGIFDEHLFYITAKLYISSHVVYFAVTWYNFPVLVCCTMKNLATLLETARWALGVNIRLATETSSVTDQPKK
jgi:hypothetical protein